MKRLRICLGILVALVFQAAVVPALFPRWIVPDVVFCASAVAAITGGAAVGVLVALVGGLMQDALTGAFIGANAGADMAVAAAIGMIQPELFKESLLTPAAVIGLGSIARELVYIFVIWSFGAAVDMGRALFVVLPGVTVMNCVTGVLIYRWYYLVPRARLEAGRAGGGAGGGGDAAGAGRARGAGR